LPTSTPGSLPNRETLTALEMETEAHNVLDVPATRTRVGQYLMYAKRFDEAEATLRPVLGTDDVRSVLIAWTQLLSVAKRRVEDLRGSRGRRRTIRCESAT
jgi:hypothetical protein